MQSSLQSRSYLLTLPHFYKEAKENGKIYAPNVSEALVATRTILLKDTISEWVWPFALTGPNYHNFD